VRKIDAVIFDLGNVLLPFDWEIPANRFCVRTGRSRRELDDYIVTTPFVYQLGLGQIEPRKFFAIIARDFEFDGTYEEFAELWSDMFTPNEPLLAMAANLKGHLPRFILSNTNAIHIEFVFRRYAFIRDFEGHILSHEVGLQKPDPRIYQLTVEKFGLTPGRAVFIDDLLVNVDAARAFGLRAIHHQTNEQTFAELTNFGVTPI